MATFIKFHTKQVGAGGTTPTQLWSGGNEAAPFTNSRMWMPLATSVGQSTIKVPAAPGAGAEYGYQGIINLALTGSAVKVTNPNTGARADWAASLPVFNPASIEPTGVSSTSVPTAGAPPLVIGVHGISYTVPSQSDVCWLGNGDAGNFTIAGTNRFIAFDWFSTVGSTATEASTQIPWPSAGVFQYCVVWHRTSATANTVQLALRKNGVDTGLVFTLSSTSADALASDLTTAVSVAAGDFINWRYVRTAGVDNGCSMAIVLGFRNPT